MLMASNKSVRGGQQTIFYFRGDGLNKIQVSQRCSQCFNELRFLGLTAKSSWKLLTKISQSKVD